MWEAQYYKHDTPRTLITSGGLGTMGFALPAAIGAQARAARRRGLGRRRRRRLPDDDVPSWRRSRRRSSSINIAIINNGYLGMVRQWQEFFYERRYAATPLHSPDFVKLAEALRPRRAARSTQRDEVAGAVAGARASAGHASLIDFRVEQEDSRLPDGAGRRRPAQDDPPARRRSSRRRRLSVGTPEALSLSSC